MRTIKGAIEAFANERHATEWAQLDGLRHSKKYITNITTGLYKNIANLNKGHIRLLTGALTGHFATNEQLTRMKITTDPTCRACGDSNESIPHLLCDCDALARKRMNLLGLAYPGPEDFEHLPRSCIISLMQFIFAEG